MFYSEEVIDEVRSRSNIVDIIGNYVHLKKKGNDYFGLCPFHNEKTGSFSVSQDKQMFYCFGCGKGGSVFTFLMEYENYTYPEAIEYLALQAGVELPKEEATKEQRQLADYRATLREMNKDAANYFYRLLRQEHGKRGYEYLQKRQISDDTIKKFGLGYSDKYRDDLYLYLKHKGYSDADMRDSGLVEIEEQGGHDKFWNRVMFPIVDMNGKVIGFGGRVMGEGEPKYLNSKETALFEKKKNLYGLNFARRSKRNGFILCEGYMDVISMHQAGFDNAVASLGTAFTVEQAQLIKRYCNHVYLAYDSDGAGQKAALRAIAICRSVDLPARVIDMKPHKDPDEFIKNLGAEEYENRIKHSTSGIMFELHVLTSQYPLDDPEGRTQFQHAVAKRLSGIKDKLERENYVESAAAQYHINQAALLELVNKIGEANYKGKQFKELENQDKKMHQQVIQSGKEGGVQQERLVLKWVSDYPQLWQKVSQYVKFYDFTDAITRQIAEIYEEQYERCGEIKPAEMIDRFADVALHAKVSEVLNTPIQIGQEGPEQLENDQIARSVTEAVKRLKRDSIKRRRDELVLSECPDAEKNKQFHDLLDEQQQIENLYITLDNG